MARSGWAYGDQGSADSAGKWLTILGSAYRAPELYATQEQAEQALEVSGKASIPYLCMVVAHVTEVRHAGCSGGYAYRITQPQNA